MQAHDHKHQPMIFGPASLVGGSLTSERERMAAQVFQPSHRYVPCLIYQFLICREEMLTTNWLLELCYNKDWIYFLPNNQSYKLQYTFLSFSSSDSKLASSPVFIQQRDFQCLVPLQHDLFYINRLVNLDLLC